MSQVNCEVFECAFNSDGCKAIAVTMGTESCKTFIALDEKGGLPSVKAQVGACQQSDCAHNDHLVCQAKEVKIGAGEKCLSYEAA